MWFVTFSAYKLALGDGWILLVRAFGRDWIVLYSPSQGRQVWPAGASPKLPPVAA